MKTKTISAVVVIALVLLGGWYLLDRRSDTQDSEETTEIAKTTEETQTTTKPSATASTPTSPASTQITNTADLEAELNSIDVDGLDNELYLD